MADLYRKSSLERISSPVQLDKTLKITSPLSWLALLGITVIIIVTVIWSITGTIPETITTNGIIVSPVSTNSVYTEESGTVTDVYVSAGDTLNFGDSVMAIKTNRGETLVVTSDQTGTVSEIISPVETTVNQNTEVICISPLVTGKQVVVCYVPFSVVRKIERGMSAYIYLFSTDSQTYGHMVADVINIDSKATSYTSMNYILGSDNNLSSYFLSDGAVTAVVCELNKSNETENGYYWSGKKGGTVDVSNGSLCTVRIITDRISPVSKLFSKIEEI